MAAYCWVSWPWLHLIRAAAGRSGETTPVRKKHRCKHKFRHSLHCRWWVWFSLNFPVEHSIQRTPGSEWVFMHVQTTITCVSCRTTIDINMHVYFPHNPVTKFVGDVPNSTDAAPTIWVKNRPCGYELIPVVKLEQQFGSLLKTCISKKSNTGCPVWRYFYQLGFLCIPQPACLDSCMVVPSFANRKVYPKLGHQAYRFTIITYGKDTLKLRELIQSFFLMNFFLVNSRALSNETVNPILQSITVGT